MIGLIIAYTMFCEDYEKRNIETFLSEYGYETKGLELDDLNTADLQDLINYLEKAFKVKFTTFEIDNITTISELAELTRKKYFN